MATSLASGQKPTGVTDLDSSQTLENKTLDSTCDINGSDVISASIQSPVRADVKKDTLSNLQTYALTASNGQLCFATDAKKMYQVLDAALAEVGSGQGGINYISNPDAELNTDGWSTYADAAGANAVDGTGGSPNITFTRNTTTPLRDTADFLLTKTAVNRQGEGVSIPFTIEKADLSKKLYISFDYLTSADYDDNDIRVQIYDVTNSRLIRCNGEDLKGTQGTHLAWFQSDATSTSYRLILHVSSTNASAYTVNLDNVQVGPREVSYGSAMTDWIDYGSIPISGTTTNPTKGTIVVDKFHGKRVGSSFIGRLDFIQSSVGTAGSGTYVINLPTGIKVDLSKTPSNASYVSANVGTVITNENGGVERHGFVTVDVNDNSRLLVQFVTNSGSALQYSYNLWSSSFVSFGGAPFGVTGQFEIPVQGWSSNSVQSEDIGNREVRVRGAGNGGTAITANTTNIDFTEVEDTTGSWNGTQFTAPETGDYDVKGFVNFTTSSNTVINAYIDGTLNKAVGFAGSTVAEHQISGTFRLTKGQVLSFRAANSLTLSNTTQYHHIHIQKLAQPQTILETETVAASYSNTSGASVGNGSNFIYETKDFDTHNSYNTSTGVYTIPVSGYYLIRASARPNASVSLAVAIFIDSTQKSDGLIISSQAIAQTSYVGYAQKGQQITIRNTVGAPVTPVTTGTNNTFSIARIK
jgi:hypothetical protein